MPQRFNILLFIAKSGYHFIEESTNRKVCSYLKLIDTCWFLLAKVYIGKLVNIRVLPLLLKMYGQFYILDWGRGTGLQHV